MPEYSKHDLKKAATRTIFPRNTWVQFRNVKVGMFSGPRPSYQQYSLGQNAVGALRRTGV